MSLEETEEEETVALVLVQIWGLRHVPDHEWSLASGLRALSMIATAGMAIAVSLWLPHSRCKPVSPASNGHQGSYGVVREEVTRGYVGLPQQNTPSPFCTSRSLAKHLSVICKPLFWGISCQLIWVLVQKWLPWYLSTTLPQSRKVLRPKLLIFVLFIDYLVDFLLISLLEFFCSCFLIALFSIDFGRSGCLSCSSCTTVNWYFVSFWTFSKHTYLIKVSQVGIKP